MDLIIYTTTAIFMISLAYILYKITIDLKEKQEENFLSGTLQENDFVGDIQVTSSKPPEKPKNCNPKISPWFDHRVIGFCDDKRLTTTGRIMFPNVAYSSSEQEVLNRDFN